MYYKCPKYIKIVFIIRLKNKKHCDELPQKSSGFKCSSAIESKIVLQNIICFLTY